MSRSPIVQVQSIFLTVDEKLPHPIPEAPGPIKSSISLESAKMTTLVVKHEHSGSSQKPYINP